MNIADCQVIPTTKSCDLCFRFSCVFRWRF